MRWKLISAMAILLMALTPSSSSSLAKAAETLPDNAVPSRYGSGWDCSSGFQRIANRCARIVVPANAHLDYTGDNWKCDRGFQGQDRKKEQKKKPAKTLDEREAFGEETQKGATSDTQPHLNRVGAV